MSILDKFRVRLVMIRKSKNLTQKQVAESIGVVERTYQYYEAGESLPQFEQLISLSHFLGVTLDYLMCQTDIQQDNQQLLPV